MQQWATALVGYRGLRSDLLIELKKAQPLTARELGVRFGLTANALRRLLKELETAGLVQAGLFSNPAFDAVLGFPIDSGSIDLRFSIVQDFLSILYRPLRKQIAAAEFEAAKLRVTEAQPG